jgi:hypothetical protein
MEERDEYLSLVLGERFPGTEYLLEVILPPTWELLRLLLQSPRLQWDYDLCPLDQDGLGDLSYPPVAGLLGRAL